MEAECFGGGGGHDFYLNEATLSRSNEVLKNTEDFFFREEEQLTSSVAVRH